MYECLYSFFHKMLTWHYLIAGVNSWFYAKTGPNVNSIKKNLQQDAQMASTQPSSNPKENQIQNGHKNQ